MVSNYKISIATLPIDSIRFAIITVAIQVLHFRLQKQALCKFSRIRTLISMQNATLREIAAFKTLPQTRHKHRYICPCKS